MAIGDDEVLRIPFKRVVFLVAGLPLTALGFCVLWSVVFHFDSATSTHCGVPNFLPSISAAVAKLEPERYVWRIFVALHSAPRLALALAFRNFLSSSPLKPLSSLNWFPVATYFACFLNILEIIFLLMLSSISSGDNYEMHKLSFIGFLVCAMSYMYISTWLFDYSGRRRTVSLGERSFQYKVFCCGASTISLIMALYFFYRHNTYCEPGIYTFFALSEYFVVIFNILFHSTLHFDFYGRTFSLLTSSVFNQYESLPMHRDD